MCIDLSAERNERRDQDMHTDCCLHEEKCVRACVRIAFVFLMLQFVLALLVTRGGSFLAISESSYRLSLSLGMLQFRLEFELDPHRSLVSGSHFYCLLRL